ncbi:hypothetical protein K493DRAFT_72355 [Basidiobolus meristosporus CBS 931.73]|uniref:Uncharacterized protein n=1 Tax=Basidiobolus meristosporus CBS 931.73 TaxID=1314790 RepID=A0A1Y1XTI9_9FUNG|nr:hypothetical protein K493DRAFT_72355 [Basidiobolus meristosporus CBS 931.73]|eukprot:ORX89050.1 hypothetical protein K493DRAFT_72355 [Basidiobolus meristosporus CBS 931.73]
MRLLSSRRRLFILLATLPRIMKPLGPTKTFSIESTIGYFDSDLQAVIAGNATMVTGKSTIVQVTNLTKVSPHLPAADAQPPQGHLR